MDKQTKIECFRQIVNEMADLYSKKNENYGDSFGKLYDDLGPIAGLVPLHNKLDRITNLVKGGSNNFESLEDSFKDLACYAIMNLIEMQEKESEKIQEVKKDTTVKINDNSRFIVTPIFDRDTTNPYDVKTVLLNDSAFKTETLYFNNQEVKDENIKKYFVNGENKPKENK